MLKSRFFALVLALVPAVGFAAGKVQLQDAQIDLQDKASLQRGAGLFMNYCAACHSLQYMRYSRLAEDLELTPAQVESFLIKGDAKIGDVMKTGMAKGDATAWFGKAPPDLSTTARGKIGQEDWIYTFLKSFYVDESRPKGWNNTVLAGASMPNVLWDLQGIQRATFEPKAEGGHCALAEKDGRCITGFVVQEHERGRMTEAEYDRAILDITAFLTYVGEPARLHRESLGVWVILFLSFFTFMAWLLKREYWKDVH
ncbi:MAG: cytochrome c1 [Lysobacteraceae bacterium]|jgi:ubiquinol-cytochrome c reductase cytochrome c1 subunit|nr:cytochrome c1 [Xanthomonadaceae bacterium]MCZ8318925.1 cytochrome c1 [Silanimonas sp.]